MKEEQPFNPIVISDLALPPTDSKIVKLETNATRRKTMPRRKSGKATPRHRALDPKQQAIRLARKVSRKAKTSWKRIKGGINSRLAHLDREKLRKVLLACGIAAAAVAAICILVKLTPLIIAMLAVLGLGVVIQTWDRLRPMRPA
jgi:Flp pilus assembly protein TadB